MAIRNRAACLQQRQHRLRSYGVSAAHGDGQTLLPISNSSNSQPVAHRHANNNNNNNNNNHHHPQQQYSSISEIQLRRVPPPTLISTTSISTSTSTAITTVISNSYSHDPRNQQQGMRTIRLVASSKPRMAR